LLGSQTALAVDFIDRQVPRVYGQPPISFEDWAHLRWARGEHGRERLAESYLEQLRPESGRLRRHGLQVLGGSSLGRFERGSKRGLRA